MQDLKRRVDFAQEGISQMKLKLLQQEAPCHPTAGLKQQDQKIISLDDQAAGLKQQD